MGKCQHWHCTVGQKLEYMVPRIRGVQSGTWRDCLVPKSYPPNPALGTWVAASDIFFVEK
eukprot:scaffold208649_cov24-Attheya_sp.AAC.1